MNGLFPDINEKPRHDSRVTEIIEFWRTHYRTTQNRRWHDFAPAKHRAIVKRLLTVLDSTSAKESLNTQ